MDLDKLTKIASGGQADIYDLGGGRVLRLLFREQDRFLAEYEFKALRAVRTHYDFVPEVYELTTVAGKPGIVMEKIDGPTMMEMIRRSPLQLFSKAREFGEMHGRVNGIPAPEGFMDLRARARFLVGKSDALDEAQKKFVMSVLEQLPDGTALCHGDFHPGNILISDGRPFIIDWCSSTRADPVADAAHSYLLCKNVPRLPGMPRLEHAIIKSAASAMGRTYLKAYRGVMRADFGLFPAWLLVMAAERTYKGMPSERNALVRFVERCRKDYGAKHEFGNRQDWL